MVFNGLKSSVIVVVTVIVNITQSSPFLAVPQKTLSLEDLIPLNLEFYPERLSVQWISETEYIYSDPLFGTIKKYNALNDTEEAFVTEEVVANLGKYSISAFSKDMKYLLLSTNRKKVYRYSSTAEYAVYNLQDKTSTKIGEGQLQAAVWGRDRALAYVQRNNVYYVADVIHADKVTTLTNNGVPDEVYNGITDWIYEEEIFNAAEALWFSPNGSYLAVASFNDTNVESTFYPHYGNAVDVNNQYPEIVEFKYPKAGRHNPVVGLQVFKMDRLESEPWIIAAPVGIVGIDHVLGRVNWASDQNLIVLWLNRRQNVSVLVNCDLQNDVCDMVQERSEPNGWIDITEPIFGKSKNKMVDVQPLYHGDQRFMHASLLDFETKAMQELSPGNSTVVEVYGWNEETDTVYFLVSPSMTPWQRHVWASSKGSVRCVTCKEHLCHSVVANFSPGARYAIMACTASNIAPRLFLYNAQNDSFKLLKDNSKLNVRLSQYKMPLPAHSILPLSQDVVAHVKLLLPPDMDPGERYPMVVKVYGGPGTTRVKDNFELDYSTYLATNRSFVVASIDVRGTGAMGVEAMHSINNALGTLEVSDTLHAIRKLVKMHKFIDDERVAVWGWSYGGFTTGMMLALDNRNTLACGAAIAPVTSWLYYDTFYTERFMDTPAKNPSGYQHAGLVNLAEKLRGRRFLLVHGSGDDNVHYQNSMLLAKRLQHLDIAFEQMSYADENHSLLGVGRHLYHMLDHFWSECFA